MSRAVAKVSEKSVTFNGGMTWDDPPFLCPCVISQICAGLEHSQHSRDAYLGFCYVAVIRKMDHVR